MKSTTILRISDQKIYKMQEKMNVDPLEIVQGQLPEIVNLDSSSETDSNVRNVSKMKSEVKNLVNSETGNFQFHEKYFVLFTYNFTNIFLAQDQGLSKSEVDDPLEFDANEDSQHGKEIDSKKENGQEIFDGKTENCPEIIDALSDKSPVEIDANVDSKKKNGQQTEDLMKDAKKTENNPEIITIPEKTPLEIDSKKENDQETENENKVKKDEKKDDDDDKDKKEETETKDNKNKESDNKTAENEENKKDTTKEDKKEDEKTPLQVDVIIPSKIQNMMIGGAGGKLIQSISDDCGGVAIKFPAPDANSDKVAIRGPKEGIEKAKKKLVDLSKIIENANERQLNSISATIRAKPEHHKILIGHNGMNIQSIRDKTGARIIFPSEKDEDREIISILGTKESVASAKIELESHIKDFDKVVEEIQTEDYSDISEDENFGKDLRDILAKKIEMKKVKIEVIKPWINERVVQIFGKEVDAIVEFIFNQLEAKDPDPRKMQISLTGFLNDKNARIFMGELWDLLDSAQKTTSGIPKELINKKKEEEIQALKKELTDANELINTLKFTQVYTQLVTCQGELLEAQKQLKNEEEKSIKLSETITELQGLLKQAIDRYGSLEDHFEKEKVEHKDELKRRNDAIRALRKELMDVRDLVKGVLLVREGLQKLFEVFEVRMYI